MIKEEIDKLKETIKDGWAMANDPLCSKGFEAADDYILYLEMQLDLYRGALDSIIAGAKGIRESLQKEKDA